ncbi:condensation domain-containing protein [Streptomyces roseolus]|uniref:condensation domain-containing protein n=1 Tax=Streptomyces roseolus TaxID=67358 RepID=UPI0016791FE3|nr:condensation domain-containing protein [Streptomyces roseolus]
MSSVGQERLWFLDRLEPGDPAYDIPYVLRLGGALDATALGRALDDAVARREALRLEAEHEIRRKAAKYFAGETRW